MPSDQQLISEIGGRFPALPKPVRDALRKQLTALDKLDPVEKDDFDWLLYGFMTELRNRNIWVKSLADIKMQSYYRTFAPRSIQLREYFEINIPGMSRREKVLLGEIIAKALADDLAKWTTVCLEFMMVHADKIPGILNHELPDYLRTGFLGAMIGRPLEEMNAHISNPA